MRAVYSMCVCVGASRVAATSGVGRLGQAPDVQGTTDVVLYGALVPPHHRADGLSQTAQVVEDLQGCAHLGGILNGHQREDEE